MPFECEVCQEKFLHRSGLQSHLSAHSWDKPFECEVCHRGFSQKNHLRAHRRIHFEKYECKLCQRYFENLEQLKVHDRMHSEKKRYPCDVCQERFARKVYLEAHAVLHTEQEEYRCKICYESFFQKSNLRSHLCIHTKEKLYECCLCTKTFIDLRELDSHMSDHSKDKVFQCRFCQKICSRFTHLRQHAKDHAHHAQELHTSPESGNSSSSLQLPERESSVESDDALVQAKRQKTTLDDSCPESFNQSRDLMYNTTEKLSTIRATSQSHFAVSSSTKSAKSYSRTYASKTGGSANSDLFELVRSPAVFRDVATEQNLERLHNKICDTADSSSMEMLVESHEKGQLFVCEICQEGFLDDSALRTHAEVHGKAIVLECDVCHEMFSDNQDLATHMKSHIKQNMFDCNICHKAFSEKLDLEVHIKEKHEMYNTEEENSHDTYTKDKACETNSEYDIIELESSISLREGKQPDYTLYSKTQKKTVLGMGDSKLPLEKHKDRIPVKCEICQESFPDLFTLSMHSAEHVKAEFVECQVCYERFPDDEALVAHAEMHEVVTCFE